MTEIMSEKKIGILVVGVILVGVVVALVNQFNSTTDTASINLPQPTGVVDNQTPSTSSATMKQYSKFPGELSKSELENKKAVITTNKGTIEFEIFSDAPKAASNFITLTKDGFYDNLTFHRVVPGFVIQGGDPAGNGTGGPGYMFEDEKVTRKYDQGIVAMANAGANTNGSQFFIMLEDNPTLPPNYTIFGKVLIGQEVVDKIAVGDKMTKVTIANLK